MKQSKAWQWNAKDTQVFLKQTWDAIVPYLVVFIPGILEFIPRDWAYAATVIWILNRILHAARLYKAGK